MREIRLSVAKRFTSLLDEWVETGDLSTLINLHQLVCNITYREQDRLRALVCSDVYEK